MEFILLRSAFLAIVSFDFLTSAKILNIPLHFPWLVIFLISALTWLCWELILRKRIEAPSLAAAFFLFQLYADNLGNTFKFYDRFNWYDNFTHFTGGVAIAVLVTFLLKYLSEKGQWKIKTKAFLIFAISLALSITVFYELVELFIYQVLNYKEIIIGETDTADDLLFNLLGILAVNLFLYYFLLKKNQPVENGKDSKTK